MSRIQATPKIDWDSKVVNASDSRAIRMAIRHVRISSTGEEAIFDSQRDPAYHMEAVYKGVEESHREEIRKYSAAPAVASAAGAPSSEQQQSQKAARDALAQEVAALSNVDRVLQSLTLNMTKANEQSAAVNDRLLKVFDGTPLSLIESIIEDSTLTQPQRTRKCMKEVISKFGGEADIAIRTIEKEMELVGLAIDPDDLRVLSNNLKQLNDEINVYSDVPTFPVGRMRRLLFDKLATRDNIMHPAISKARKGLDACTTCTALFTHLEKVAASYQSAPNVLGGSRQRESNSSSSASSSSSSSSSSATASSANPTAVATVALATQHLNSDMALSLRQASDQSLQAARRLSEMADAAQGASSTSLTPCRYFLEGHCKKGDQCDYSHDTGEKDEQDRKRPRMSGTPGKGSRRF
jgi:hypothetical protein